MKIIKLNSAQKHRKSDGSSSSIAIEYLTGNRDINIAEVVVHGRYPAKGWATNRLSTMVVFVLSGTGKIRMKEGNVVERFSDKDVIEIPAGEAYAWEPDIGVIIRLLPASTPAWTSEQHQTIE